MTVEYARIVGEIPPPEERAALESPHRANWRLELHEVLGLAATLRDAGYAVGELAAQAEAAADELASATAPPTAVRVSREDLRDPKALAERVRRDAFNMLAAQQLGSFRTDAERDLADLAAEGLREASDPIVADMRRTFDPAVAVVRAAADRGLRAGTDAQALADTADSKTLDAYRRLGPAVAELDRVARLRLMMAQVGGIGPREHPVANLIAAAPDMATLVAAQDLWRGPVEAVTHNDPAGRFSHPARIPVKRLGGPWLALVAAGHEIRVNTADEADAVLAAASRHPVPVEVVTVT